MWEEMSLGITATLSDYLEIIDDALCFGFEFKVENFKIYFKEFDKYEK